MSGSKHPPASRRTLEVEMDPEVKHSVEDEEYLSTVQRIPVDPTIARALAEKKAITPNYWAHDSEYRVLTALVDGPKHERDVCDRALAQVLENHGSITMAPHESGGMQLSITDKGRGKL